MTREGHVRFWERLGVGFPRATRQVFVRIRGKLHYLWRAVDQHGHVLDVLVQSRRNAKAAKRFFRKLLRGLQYVPRVIVTDKLRSYGAAKREILPGVEHRQSRYLNNRAEVSHRRHDDENGRCSASSQRAMHSASSLPTAGSTTTSSSAVTVSPPPSTVPLATTPFASGAISPRLLLRRELDVRSGQPSISRPQPDNAVVPLAGGPLAD